MDLKKVSKISLAGGILSLFLLVLAGVLPKATGDGLALWIVLPLFFFVFVFTIAFNAKYWRCPKCNFHLGRDVMKHCSACGAELFKEESQTPDREE